VADVNAPPTIEVRGLRKVFRQATSGQQVVAIDRLDLTIQPKEVIAIVGQTGCGKSTFFDMMIGLEPPTEGYIHVGDKSPYADFDFFRGKMATVFQQDRLLPWRTALDNVALPLELAGVRERDRHAAAAAWLDRLGLAGFHHAFPAMLSGGMRQRVAIARALAADPPLLLADEAFSSLDIATGRALRAELRAIARATAKTVLHITHSVDEAIEVSDRILVLGRPGRLLAEFGAVAGAGAQHRASLRRAIEEVIEGTAGNAGEIATGEGAPLAAAE